jgi:hypothetical protein
MKKLYFYFYNKFYLPEQFGVSDYSGDNMLTAGFFAGVITLIISPFYILFKLFKYIYAGKK